MSTTIPTTWFGADTLLRSARNEANGKPVANNTRLFRRSDDTIALRLHDTDVVDYHRDGSLTLRTGGWLTVTTKARINEALGMSFAVFSDKGRWYISRVGEWDVRVPFADGMTVHPDRPLPRDEAAERIVALEDQRNRDMRKAVRRFVGGITADQIVHAWENPQGDCLYCQMGSPTTDCLTSHVQEGYFHAHLALNALRRKGYVHPEVIMSMIYADAQRGRISDLLTRNLSSYLRKALAVGMVAAA